METDFRRKEELDMLTVEGLIAVISLCVGCFGLGYEIGSHGSDNTKK